MRLVWICVLLAGVAAAAKKERVWVPAVVDQTFLHVNGAAYVPGTGPSPRTVKESIYVDAGEWLFNVSRVVLLQGALNLREGARIEVAEDGKHLILRVGDKEFSTTIDHKSKGKKRAR